MLLKLKRTQMSRGLALIITACAFFIQSAFAQSAEFIVDKADESRTFSYLSFKGSMLVKDRFGTRAITMNSYSRGKEDMLMEFTSVEEKGQKILRTQKEIYIYYPDAENLVRIQGAGMRDSMMGSDASYEDITRDKKTLDQYDAKLLGTEEGFYKIELVAKKGSHPAYYKQIWWVNKKNYLLERGEYYSLSDKLLKKYTAIKSGAIDGRPYVVQFSLQNMLTKGTLTTVSLSEGSTKALPSSKFSINNLSF